MKTNCGSDLWLAPAAGALPGLAGHLYLILHYGTVLPYRDPWQLMGVELIRPWLDGELTWRAFFQPLNDHWPVLTRAWSFVIFRLNGQWNNAVQITANALLFSGMLFVLLRIVLPAVPPAFRAGLALLAGAIAALPIGWENTLWSIQSLPYFQLLFTGLFIGGVLLSPGFSKRWYLSLAAGLMVLLNQHSAILAHVALLPVLTLLFWRHPKRRRETGVALVFCGITTALFFALHPPMETTAHLRADSIPLFLRSRFDNWPGLRGIRHGLFYSGLLGWLSRSIPWAGGVLLNRWR